jgi:hypothetical protein
MLFNEGFFGAILFSGLHSLSPENHAIQNLEFQYGLQLGPAWSQISQKEKLQSRLPQTIKSPTHFKSDSSDIEFGFYDFYALLWHPKGEKWGYGLEINQPSFKHTESGDVIVEEAISNAYNTWRQKYSSELTGYIFKLRQDIDTAKYFTYGIGIYSGEITETQSISINYQKPSVTFPSFSTDSVNQYDEIKTRTHRQGLIASFGIETKPMDLLITKGLSLRINVTLMQNPWTSQTSLPLANINFGTNMHF